MLYPKKEIVKRYEKNPVLSALACLEIAVGFVSIGSFICE